MIDLKRPESKDRNPHHWQSHLDLWIPRECSDNCVRIPWFVLKRVMPVLSPFQGLYKGRLWSLVLISEVTHTPSPTSKSCPMRDPCPLNFNYKKQNPPIPLLSHPSPLPSSSSSPTLPTLPILILYCHIFFRRGLIQNSQVSTKSSLLYILSLYSSCLLLVYMRFPTVVCIALQHLFNSDSFNCQQGRNSLLDLFSLYQTQTVPCFK